ncbi:MAG: TIM-barrel domain-containing protein [Chloroflexota bacterium]
MTPDLAPSFPLTRDGSTVSVATPLGTLQITVCTPRIVRIRLVQEGQLSGFSYVEPREWPTLAIDLTSGEPTRVNTGAFTVRFQTTPLGLVFEDPSGTTLLRAPIDAALVVDTVHRRTTTSNAAVDRTRIGTRFTWPDEQHFYGLGEGGKQFDRLDGTRQLWNSHFGRGPGSDIGVPLLVSTAGYGLFFDNTNDARLVVGRTEDDEQLAYEAEGGALDWYFLYGTDLRGVLGEVASLLGHAPLPPRWALGFMQSTRHFDDTAELLSLPRILRERRIPCDAIIFLSTYGDAMGWNRGVGHLEFQPELIPNPAEVLTEIREQGFQVITHEYPVLHEESPLFAEAQARGFLVNEGYERRTPATRPSTNFQEGQRYIDFSNPAVRRWWWEQHRGLADLGVGAWWLDGGEGPSSAARLHGGDGTALHNIYDRLRFEAFADGEARDYPDRRPFFLCRSGAAGMARFGATCWSGDVNNTFATLEVHVPLGLNTGMSGIPNWGSDIGGFFHPTPETGELYARWFQFGAFCPGFRAHGWVWREHLPWSHGPEVEAICRRYIELRYRLLPYTYTLAWQAHTQGLPFMRPLVLNYPNDPKVWELGSQYLWGDDLLVAPVTREGATAWPAYLPEGTWYDYWTGQRYAGPLGVTVEAPLDRLPLFVRGGAILPLAPPARFDGDQPWDEITLLIYPEGSSRFELYEDDGRTNAYRQGRYAVTAMSCTVAGSRTTVHIAPPVGTADVLPSNRRYTIQLLAESPGSVLLDGAALSRQNTASEQGAGYWHDGGRFVYVRLDTAQGTVIIDQ